MFAIIYFSIVLHIILFQKLSKYINDNVKNLTLAFEKSSKIKNWYK